MKLFLQSSSGRYQLALADSDTILFESGGFDHFSGSRDFAEMLSFGLKTIGGVIGDIREVVADVGPGGLAATRGGVVFANTLAYGLALDLKGARAFDLIHAHLDDADVLPTVVIRRGPHGRCHWGLYCEAAPAEFGLDTPQRIASRIEALSGEVRLAGVVSLLDEVGFPHVTLHRHAVNEAAMHCFLKVEAIRPDLYDGIKILHPLT